MGPLSEQLLCELERIAADRTELAEVPEEQRKRLLAAVGKIANPDERDLRRLRKAMRRIDRREERAHDRALLDATQMRAAQRSPVFVPPPKALPSNLPHSIDGASAHTSGEPVVSAAEPKTDADVASTLRSSRHCYVCKQHFTTPHHFYDQMCPTCADLNYEKRFQTADLTGRVALVTGARVKIGYQIALRLLDAGARVIVTSRFPHDAALRFAREKHFSTFRDRLEIHGLDLRHAPSVEWFAEMLSTRLPRLDYLINNAAQTVRRPAGFYTHLVATELAPVSTLPPDAHSILAEHQTLVNAAQSGGQKLLGTEQHLLAFRGERELVGVSRSAALSQLPITPDDVQLGAEAFPVGRVDQDLQQVDLRTHNSWRMRADEVPLPELLEVHLVNAVAPFVLVAKLRAKMAQTAERAAHIVNVSAMEAQFSRRHKTDKHPHTNMAKAALNMLTRTSAQDYVNDGIHMNSVDTGWVTDEDPLHHAVRKQDVHEFYPPLDIVDGAARVLDPIFSGVRTGEHAWGKFFKDYRSVGW